MTRDEIIEAFDAISDLSRHLRQGGCDTSDLAELEEALSEAVDIASNALQALSAQPAGEPFIEGWQTKSYESGERPTGFLGPQPAGVASEETIEADFVTANMIHEWRLGARKAGVENDARFSELTDREIADGLRCAIRIYGEAAPPPSEPSEDE